MSIRKAIAQQLSKASKALEEDQSKEKISLILTAARVGIANAIMPKISSQALIRTSELGGANPPTAIAFRGDGHRTHGDIHVSESS
jgi:hypothetical protein